MDDADSRSKIQTVCLMVLTAVTIGHSIYWLQPVLVPFVVAVFVVSGVAPIIERLEKKLGVNRLFACGIAFFIGLLVLALLGISLWASVVELADNAADYRESINEFVKKTESWIPTRGGETETAADAKAGEEAAAVQKQRIGEFLDGMLQTAISQLSQTFLNLVSTSIIVLIYVFFLLLGASVFMQPTGTWAEIDSQIRSYLGLKTLISIGTGIVFGLALYLFGVPMAVTFGVLAFLLNYIPNIGPIIAAVLPIPFIVFFPDASIGWMVAVILVTMAIQTVSGNVIEPQIMGDSSDLHPVVVLIALMFWGMIWGIVGMFLATPITAGIRIVLERIEATKPIAKVMSGQFMGTGKEKAEAST